MHKNKLRSFIIFSPFIIVALGFFIAKLAGAFLGIWVWIPITLSLWSVFAITIIWSGGRPSIRRWLSKAENPASWAVLALAIGLIPLPLFLQNRQLFTSPWLILAWFIFALINAPLEEFYWRGALTDHTANWPDWFSVVYSSFFFAINHPLSYGVYSLANRHPITTVSTFVMGITWAITYRKTQSLRWIILAHFLVDLFNLSILAFLNIYIPPALP